MRLPPSMPRFARALVPSVITGVILGVAGVPAAAQEVEHTSFLEAVRGGTTRIDLRYRFELVDVAAAAETARASTLRTALTYRSGSFHGFEFVLQAENVSDLGAAALHANAGAGSFGNGVAGRPVIADPAFTALSQGFLRYRGGDTTVAAGRQEIVIGDARFVGNVGWRQHHQGYRALRVTDTSIDGLTLGYAYIDRVHRVTGARQDAAIHLIDTTYEIERIGTVTAYAWILEFDQAVTLSTRTLGAELRGVLEPGGAVLVPYEIEFAHQSDIGRNPERVDVDYLHVSAGIQHRAYRVRAGWERLGGGRDEGSFTTTLATLHAFNGWADQFLVTPTDGLDDLYVSASGPIGPLALRLDLHGFSAASTDTSYGSELDVQLEWSAHWEQTFGLRGAFYQADRWASDTHKLWFYTTTSF